MLQLLRARVSPYLARAPKDRNARTLLPAALASVPFGFVLVLVRVRVPLVHESHHWHQSQGIKLHFSNCLSRIQSPVPCAIVYIYSLFPLPLNSATQPFRVQPRHFNFSLGYRLMLDKQRRREDFAKLLLFRYIGGVGMTLDLEERNSVQDEGENPPPNSDTSESEPEHNRIFVRTRY